jgi:hypothetical protein
VPLPTGLPTWMGWASISSLFKFNVYAGNTKGGSITVPLTSCLNGLESAV